MRFRPGWVVMAHPTPTSLRNRVRSLSVPDVQYEFWIDELTRSPLPTGGVIVHRLYAYGPFQTLDDAEKMVEQLKRQPRGGVLPFFGWPTREGPRLKCGEL